MNLPPLGVTINTDGTVTITEAATLKSERTYAFGICAVDLGGQEACTEVKLAVVDILTICKDMPKPTTVECCPTPTINMVPYCGIRPEYFDACFGGKCPTGTVVLEKYSSVDRVACGCQ